MTEIYENGRKTRLSCVLESFHGIRRDENARDLSLKLIYAK